MTGTQTFKATALLSPLQLALKCLHEYSRVSRCLQKNWNFSLLRKADCYRWAPSAPLHKQSALSPRAEKWIITLISSSSAPWMEETQLQQKAWQACLLSNFSLHVQTQNLAVCNPSSRGKPPRLLVSLQTLPVCSGIPELCQTHSIYFNELQLITSKCSFKFLLAWQPNEQQGTCTWEKKKSYPGHTHNFSKRKGMLRYCRWESRWQSPSYLFRLLVLLSVVGNIT